MNEKEKQFLKELAELTNKYKLYIEGSCGSFEVYNPENGRTVEYLGWNGKGYTDEL